MHTIVLTPMHCRLQRIGAIPKDYSSTKFVSSIPLKVPEPEVFDPERFSGEEKSNRNIYTFLPFGAGPRHCIGVRFGMMQIKVGVVTLLKNYRISLSRKTEIPIKFDPKCFVLTVKGGIWIDAERI